MSKQSPLRKNKVNTLHGNISVVKCHVVYFQTYCNCTISYNSYRNYILRGNKGLTTHYPYTNCTHNKPHKQTYLKVFDFTGDLPNSDRSLK